MKELMGITGTLAKKMNGWQSFMVLLLIVLGFVALPVWSTRSQTATNKMLLNEIVQLNRNIEGRNLNSVDYKTACDNYDDIFESSMLSIVRMAMVTISRNHIDDPARRQWIRDQYTLEIMALYNDDLSKLSKLRYDRKKLSGVMNDINPEEAVNSVLGIIFDTTLSKEQRYIDVDREMSNRADTYYQLGVMYLNKD